jgi:GNAT superfamily N-acetyltransferase
MPRSIERIPESRYSSAARVWSGAEPHYYLSLLGTHPDHRGAGHGMRLLADNLERIETEGMPAYLESTNPANNPRYGRVGFEIVGSFEGYVAGSVITTMWRPARR